jgi:hypothetical protein
MPFLERNRPILRARSAQLKLEMAVDIGLNCMGRSAEKKLR